MSMILLAGPLGIVLGYSLTGVIVGCGYNWRWSFIVQGGTMAVSFVVILLIPSSFLNTDEVIQMKRIEKCRR